ncbi:MAG TPA: hypothetical protein VG076_07885 [Acidimicrobiales bacterium]|jgi:hypothetical protein|nr:hypothetical protein [Acidimicrobiales bacterium]
MNQLHPHPVALVLVAVLLSSCGGHGSSSTSATTASLPRIVLQQADVPPGSQPLTGSSGPRTAEQLAQDDRDSKETSAFTADRLRGAYTAAFVSPTAAAAGGAATMRLTGSYAAVFPTADAATRAVGVLRQTAQTNTGGNPVTEVAAPGLGADAFGLDTTSQGVIGNDYAFGWRVDNAVVSVLVGTNSATPDAGPALAIAQKVARQSAGRTALTPADLPRLVLPPSQAPPGTQFDQGRSGARTVDMFAGQPGEADQLRALGYQAGIATLFLPQTTSSGNAPAGASLIRSTAQLYATSSGATSAFRSQTHGSLRAFGQGLGTVPARGLGDEAVGFSFSTLPGVQDYPGYLYAIRRGNLVLVVWAFGPPRTVTTQQVRHYADLMDHRAAGAR